MNPRPRLIDLHLDWFSQYGAESTVCDPPRNPYAAKRADRLAGYLGGTSAVVLALGRSPRDWARFTDPWVGLAELIARQEAEFCGRLLMGPEDRERWHRDTGGLSWGLLGIDGLEPLIRQQADLAHLATVFDRGARMFRLTDCVAEPDSEARTLVGPGGLTQLGWQVLEAIGALCPADDCPRPILDLAGLNLKAREECLAWLESRGGEGGRVLACVSHLVAPAALDDSGSGFSTQELARLRKAGVFLGLTLGSPGLESFDDLARAIEVIAEKPFLGTKGFVGLALGSSWLEVERLPAGLDTIPALVDRLIGRFGPEPARSLLHDQAASLIQRSMGVGVGG